MSFRARATARLGISAASLRAIRLISRGLASRCRFSRKASLANRLIRLRCTAPPTLRLTVIPIREAPPLAGAAKTMKNRVDIRCPESDSAINSERFKRRSVFLKKKRNYFFSERRFFDSPGKNQPASRALPFARLRLRILRPLLVDMRFRKPWFLARLSLLG